jgi:hypothetical protein
MDIAHAAACYDAIDVGSVPAKRDRAASETSLKGN